MSSSELRPLVDTVWRWMHFSLRNEKVITESNIYGAGGGSGKESYFIFLPSSTHVSQVACKLLLRFFSC